LVKKTKKMTERESADIIAKELGWEPGVDYP
jgi:hypothetical protein